MMVPPSPQRQGHVSLFRPAGNVGEKSAQILQQTDRNRFFNYHAGNQVPAHTNPPCSAVSCRSIHYWLTVHPCFGSRVSGNSGAPRGKAVPAAGDVRAGPVLDSVNQPLLSYLAMQGLT